MELLGSPVFIGSIAILLINDHILKAAFPGFVTGKLSDVAGVVMIAVLATAIVRRPTLACMAVAGAFALLKTVPAVADLAIPVLGGRTLTDPTDVLAVTALVPLWQWMRSAEFDRNRNSQTGSLAVRFAALAAAVIATSATSCFDPGLGTIAVVDDVIYAGGDLESFQSTDGGQTWTIADQSDVPLGREQSVCGADGICFELVDRGIERVDATGGRSTEFEVSEEEFENLLGNVESDCSFDANLFSSIASVDGPDGPSVVATMGAYGVLRRSPDGVWSWENVGEFALDDELTRDPLDGRVSATEYRILSGAIVAAIFIAGVSLAVVSSRRRLATGWVVANAIIGAVGAIALGFFALLVQVFGSDGPRGLSYSAPIIVLVVGCLLGGSLVLIQVFAKPAAPRLQGHV
jgi:hypothetical protein